MGEFQEKFQIITDRFSTGSTSVLYTGYYDMSKRRRIDFLVTGLAKLAAAGAAGATDYQRFTIAAYQASDSTGGGASAISSATAIIGKDSGTGISSLAKCRDGYINFGTLDKATDLTITINGADYQSASADTAANRFPVAGASAAATVAAQAFVTMFNSTVNNTATAVTANWAASTEGAGVAWVRIYPKDPDGTHFLVMGTTGSSMVGLGGVFTAHLGIERQFISKKYVALAINSTEHGNPYVVTVISEMDNAPTTSVAVVSKSLNAASK